MTKPKAKKPKPRKRKPKPEATTAVAPYTSDRTTYTLELAAKFCDLIAGDEDRAPMSDRKACRQPGLPHRDTIREWEKNIAGFAVAYEQARQDRGVHLFEQALAIVDTEVPMVATQFGSHTDAGAVAKLRLHFDTLRWGAAKLNPRFNDKVLNEHAGPDGGPIQVAATPMPDFNAIRAKLLKRG